MKKVLIILGFGVVALLAAFVAYLYVRDTGTMARAREVAQGIERYCRDRGHLPQPEDFARAYPGLTTANEWYYWPTRDGREVRVQYPMVARRQGAPGTPKTSEFTATTYAYVMTFRCQRR